MGDVGETSQVPVRWWERFKWSFQVLWVLVVSWPQSCVPAEAISVMVIRMLTGL